MTRKEQIVKNANEYARLMLGDICEDWSGQYTDCVTDFVAGAKWADENPNKKLVYTKKELLDMGFTFDLNGNISTPQEIEEKTKKYINYQKDKWIKTAYEWLEDYAELTGIDYETIKESFKKAIEE